MFTMGNNVMVDPVNNVHKDVLMMKTLPTIAWSQYCYELAMSQVDVNGHFGAHHTIGNL